MEIKTHYPVQMGSGFTHYRYLQNAKFLQFGYSGPRVASGAP